MLYSAHSNLTREGEGCGVQEHSGKKFKSAFYVNTQSWYTKGGIMRWRIIHESACFTAQANWRSNNKDTWRESLEGMRAGNSHLKPILTRVTLQHLRLQPENTKAWENRKFDRKKGHVINKFVIGTIVYMLQNRWSLRLLPLSKEWRLYGRVFFRNDLCFSKNYAYNQLIK